MGYSNSCGNDTTGRLQVLVHRYKFHSISSGALPQAERTCFLTTCRARAARRAEDDEIAGFSRRDRHVEPAGQRIDENALRFIVPIGLLDRGACVAERLMHRPGWLVPCWCVGALASSCTSLVSSFNVAGEPLFLRISSLPSSHTTTHAPVAMFAWFPTDRNFNRTTWSDRGGNSGNKRHRHRYSEETDNARQVEADSRLRIRRARPTNATTNRQITSLCAAH